MIHHFPHKSTVFEFDKFEFTIPQFTIPQSLPSPPPPQSLPSSITSTTITTIINHQHHNHYHHHIVSPPRDGGVWLFCFLGEEHFFEDRGGVLEGGAKFSLFSRSSWGGERIFPPPILIYVGYTNFHVSMIMFICKYF